MAVVVILTMASRPLRIFGSGTRSTRTSFVACHTNAFIETSLSVVVENGLPAARLAFDRGNLAGFHQLFEPPEVFTDRLRRLVAEQPRDGRTGLAARRIILKADADFSAAAAGGRFEMDGSGADDRRAGQRAPSDQLAGYLVVDLGLPLHRSAAGRLRDPVRAPRIDLGDGHEVVHEPRQLFERAPVVVQVVGRRIDRRYLFYVDAARTREGR